MLFDQLIWVGGGHTGRYMKELMSDFYYLSDHIVQVLSHTDEDWLWRKHEFAGSNGWVIAVDNPETAERYLRVITKLPGVHHISLLTSGVKPLLLEEIAKHKNIVLFYDDILGDSVLDFVHELVSALDTIEPSNVKVILHEWQYKPWLRCATPTPMIDRMKRIVEHYGALHVIELTDYNRMYGKTKYSYEIIRYWKSRAIAEYEVEVDSMYEFAEDAISCLEFAHDYPPDKIDYVLNNCDRYYWFPNIA